MNRQLPNVLAGAALLLCLVLLVWLFRLSAAQSRTDTRVEKLSEAVGKLNEDMAIRNKPRPENMWPPAAPKTTDDGTPIPSNVPPPVADPVPGF